MEDIFLAISIILKIPIKIYERIATAYRNLKDNLQGKQ